MTATVISAIIAGSVSLIIGIIGFIKYMIDRHGVNPKETRKRNRDYVQMVVDDNEKLRERLGNLQSQVTKLEEKYRKVENILERIEVVFSMGQALCPHQEPSCPIRDKLNVIIKKEI